MDILYRDELTNIKFYKPDEFDKTYKMPSDEELVLDLWENLNAVPTELVRITTPEVKSQYTDIEGGMGSIDLTTYLTGYPLYKNREGSFDIYMVDGNLSVQDGTFYIGMNSNGTHSKRFSPSMVNNRQGNYWRKIGYLKNVLHGKRLLMKLRYNPNSVYVGRFFVNEVTTDENITKVTIKYIIEPVAYYDVQFKATINKYSGTRIGFPTISSDATWKDYANEYVYPTIPYIYTDYSTTLSFSNEELGINFSANISPGGKANLGTRGIISNFSLFNKHENNVIDISVSDPSSDSTVTIYYTFGTVN